MKMKDIPDLPNVHDGKMHKVEIRVFGTYVYGTVDLTKYVLIDGKWEEVEENGN